MKTWLNSATINRKRKFCGRLWEDSAPFVILTLSFEGSVQSSGESVPSTSIFSIEGKNLVKITSKMQSNVDKIDV